MMASHTCSGVMRVRFSMEAIWRRSRRRRFSVGVCSCSDFGLLPTRIRLPGSLSQQNIKTQSDLIGQEWSRGNGQAQDQTGFRVVTKAEIFQGPITP